MPMFSVVVPAHNSTATLGQTLDSLISQSFVDWEAVILDDASTDGTRDLIRDVRRELDKDVPEQDPIPNPKHSNT